MSTSYTIEELQQASAELGHGGWLGCEITRMAEQADKNRIVRESARRAPIEDIRKIIKDAGFTATERNIREFTRNQVRDALAACLRYGDGGRVETVGTFNHIPVFVETVITLLCDPESYESGSYYKDAKGVVWKRSGSRWLRAGSLTLWDHNLPVRPLVKV